MKNKILLLVFSCTIVLLSRAQENNTTENNTYTRDLGFNTYFILQGVFQSQSTPFSVMYKKYTANNRALRLGVNVTYFKNDTDVNISLPNTTYLNSTSGGIDLTIGRERQKKLSGNWMWYYGGDLVPSYNFYVSDSFTDNVKVISTRSSGYGLSAKPFLGIRYNIVPRLYIAAEANAALSYKVSKFLEKRYNPETTIRDTSTTHITFDINPASGIFIFYRF